MQNGRARTVGRKALWLAVPGALVGAVAYAAVTGSGGVADPTAGGAGLTRSAAVVDSALLVLREGLEAVLVLAAITASFRGSNQSLRRPIGLGASGAFVASIATWFVAEAIIGALGGPGLDVQAATGLLAVVVLLVVMNWFFHRMYWTGWIGVHTRRKRRLLERFGAGETAAALVGFVLLGFTAVYREGFEIVLFLQNLRLQHGSAVVLEGIALGLAFTAVVGVLTFVLHERLPYKRMLVVTGVLLGVVLVVMVGETVQEFQLAGWLPTTSLGVAFPAWLQLWFASFPTAECIAAQAFAAVLVLGSYVAVERAKARRPAAGPPQAPEPEPRPAPATR